MRSTAYSSFIRMSSQPDRAASATPKHEPDREAPEAAFAAVEPFAEHAAADRQEKDKQATRQDHAADGLRDINSRPLGSVNLVSSARFGFRWHTARRRAQRFSSSPAPSFRAVS